MKRLSQCVAAVALAFGCSAPPTADLVLTGGRVHTPGGIEDVAIAILDGKIAAVSPESDLGWQVEADSDRIDLSGAHVLPGLTDAHLHFRGYGTALEQVDLAGVASWEMVVERAVAAADELPDGAWVQGRGWDQNLWPEKTFPDREALDREVPGHPVLLRRVDGHAAIANHLALELAGIDAGTPDPPGGRILERTDGAPTGVLVDTAIDLVRRVIPAASEEDIERQILRSAEALLADGLTQVHDAGTTAEELAVLRRLVAEDRLPIRVWVMLDGSDAELLELEMAAGPQTESGRMLRVGAVKLYADGALGSRGALLSAPYADDPGNRGLEVTPYIELEAVVSRANAAGFQVCIHAIGDEGVHRSLNLFAADADASRRLRHRIEHSQTVRPDDVARFAELGVIASVQPTHCTSDMPWAPERLGPERIKWAYRWRSFVDADVRLAGGSDAPVEDPDPRRGLFAAVTRQQPDGHPAGGWNPAERLTAGQALALFTRDAAGAAHAETWCGRIQPGMVADFTVVDLDPTTAEPARVLQMKVLRTIVGGRERWAAPTSGGDGDTT